MRSAAKHGAADNNRGISTHLLNLHKRLHHALNLGSWEDNKEKWQCSDIEVQRLVLRAIDAFLECVSSETLRYPLVKDSVVQMMRALEGILLLKSQAILRLALDVSVKMVNVLPSSILRSHVLDLIPRLVNLLSTQQLQVAVSCAASLNVIFSKLSSRQERQVQQILEETEAVSCIVNNIKKFHSNNEPIEYFHEMASILSKILWQWPIFRFSVWNDPMFLNVLDVLKANSETSLQVAVLQLYSSIALCGNGAEKLLENGESIVRMILACMDSSNTDLVRLEAFKLSQCFALSKRGCIKMMNICCEPLVKAITCTLSNWSLQSDEVAKSQISILEEALRLTSITRWAGNHHLYFWKAGIDRVLVNLLLDNYPTVHQLRHELSVNELIIIVRESHNSILPLSFRPYIWDILGGLAANCSENINHESLGNKLCLRVLIICACFSFINSVHTLRQVSQNSPTDMAECESACRAVLMMVYSPCKLIASFARSILSEILKMDGSGHTEYLLRIVHARLARNKFGLPGNLPTVVSLMGLACYCSIPKYEKLIINLQGMKTMVDFILCWLQNPVHTKRAKMVSHLINGPSERSCCSPDTDGWEGEDALLIYGLWILMQLLHHSDHVKGVHFEDEVDFPKAQFIKRLEEVCKTSNSHGSRWCAAYTLSYFGLFGFPSRLGDRIGKLLCEKDHSDLKLVLVNEESIHVHEVILVVRCPLLLPPESVPEEMPSCRATVEHDTQGKPIKAVRLSAHVDQHTLLKLLDYVYSGHLQASEDLIKKLKIFAKHCKLEPLVQMLCRKNPKWGLSTPTFDLSPALGTSGHHSSNIILEANSTHLVDWKCNTCSASVPHLHVHKVILASCCDYLRALFCSGMQESQLQTIKVPVKWESLEKLVTWFYSGQLPLPTFDCIWDNLDREKKFLQVHSFVELCWLAGFWLIEDLYEECYQVVLSCLDSSRYLSIRIIQVAACFSLWEVAQVAADYMASSYNQLRNSGELDDLDHNVVEMVRAASVRLSQNANTQSS